MSMVHRCALVLLLLALVSGPVRVAAQDERALLEPEAGAYFGVNLDWGTDSPAAYDERLGRQAAVYVLFLPFPFDDGALRSFHDSMEKVADQGGMAVLTLEPTIPLDEISVGQAVALAELLGEQNAAGVPIFLRFAHEMNGSWYPWSQQPIAYVTAFRLIADAVHRLADETAMLWAPSYGGGYPFTGGQYAARPGTTDFDLLDTNGDGELTMADDPYRPYYPGSGAVDWVGMSLYHWGNVYPWGENEVPEAGKFVAQLRGEYRGAGGDDTPLPDFYADYVEGRGKPLAIVETAALYNTTEGGASEAEIKRAWWEQLFAPEVFAAMPGLKMVNWFEWRKEEAEIQGDVIDWGVTATPALRDAFVARLDTVPLIYGPTT